MIIYALQDGILVETERHGPGAEAEFDLGPVTLSFDPGDLLD